MKIDKTKASICITDLDHHESYPPVIHQDSLIDNNSPILLYQTAQGLLFVSRFAARQMVETWTNNLTHTGNKNLSLLSTAAINYGFSAELFLKGILLMENGGYKRGHDLSQLFNELKDGTKNELEKSVIELKKTNPNLNWLRRFVIIKSKPGAEVETKIEYSNNPNISDFLNEHRTPFINWRYYFEITDNVKHLIFDLRFMDCFVKALFNWLGSIQHGDNNKPIGAKSH